MLVLPGGNAEKKDDYKITEKFLRKSPAQTKADSELHPMFACPALYFANALLYAAFYLSQSFGFTSLLSL
jgi:hypothetical protein